MRQTRFERARASGGRGVALAAVLSLGACVLPKITLTPVGEGGADASGDAVDVVDAQSDEALSDAASDSFDAPGDVDAPVSPLDVAASDGASDALSDTPSMDVSVDGGAPDRGVWTDAISGSETGPPPVCRTRNAGCGEGGAVCGGSDYCGGCNALCCSSDCGCRCASAPTIVASYRLQDTGAAAVSSVVEDAAVASDGSVVALVSVRRRLAVSGRTGASMMVPGVDVPSRSMLLIRIEATGSVRELFRMVPSESSAFDLSDAFVRLVPGGGIAVAWAVRSAVDLAGIGTMGASGIPLAFLVRLDADGSSPRFTRLPQAGVPMWQRIFGLEVSPTGVASVGVGLATTSFDGDDAPVGLEVHSVDRAGAITAPHLRVASETSRSIQNGALAVDRNGAVYLAGMPSDDAEYFAESAPPFTASGARFGDAFVWKVTAEGATAGFVRLDAESDSVGRIAGLGADGLGRVHLATVATTPLTLFDRMGGRHGTSARDSVGGRALRMAIDLDDASIADQNFVGPFEPRAPARFRVGFAGEEYWAGSTSQVPANFELAPGASSGRLAGVDDRSETSGVFGSLDADGAVRWLVSLTGSLRDSFEGGAVGTGGYLVAWGVTESPSPMLRTSSLTATPVTGATAFIQVLRE